MGWLGTRLPSAVGGFCYLQVGEREGGLALPVVLERRTRKPRQLRRKLTAQAYLLGMSPVGS